MLIMQRENFEYQGHPIMKWKNIFASSLTVHDIGCVLLWYFYYYFYFFPYFCSFFFTVAERCKETSKGLLNF